LCSIPELSGSIFDTMAALIPPYNPKCSFYVPNDGVVHSYNYWAGHITTLMRGRGDSAGPYAAVSSERRVVRPLGPWSWVEAVTFQTPLSMWGRKPDRVMRVPGWLPGLRRG
jgi:hypothetical protein